VRDPSTAGGAERPSSSPDDEPAASDGSGIRDTLSRLASTVLSAVDTRVQMATLEFAEERERAKQRLVLMLTVAIALAFGLLAAQALLVVVTWHTLGWRTLAILTGLWLVLAVVAGWKLSATTNREARPFATTLAELHRDRVWLIERLGRRQP